MKKLFLAFAFIASIAFTANAQETVAKIKFGEAEEAFSKNDFQTTVTKLDEAEKILNQSNSKILHLRIKAEYGILQQNPWGSYSSIENLRNKCTFYLKEYDGKAPMDKYMEVYNVSEALKKYPASSEEFNKAKEEKLRKEQEAAKIQRDSKNKQIVEEMTQRIKAKKKDHDAYYQRGRAKYAMNDTSGTVGDLNMAISLDNTNDNYYIVRGTIYLFMKKEYAKAVDDYSKAIQLNPQKDGYYNLRAKAYSQSKEYLKAVEDYSKAIQLKPQNAFYHFKRGYTYYYMKEYSKAVDDFTNAIEADPRNGEAYFYRGKTYYVFLNDKLKAEADFKKVLDLNDKSGLHAFANYFLGNKSKAIKSLQDDYFVNTDKAYWAYQLACIYSLEHNKEETFKYLKIAFEKGDYTEWAQQDEDMEFVRNTSEFKALIEQYGNKK